MGSGETLEIRDIWRWREEQVQIEEVWGSLVCAVAEAVIIGENLKNKLASLWPLSWTEARLFGVQGGERQGCRRKVLEFYELQEGAEMERA